MRGVIAAFVALAALIAAAASPARSTGVQHVTLIGDSVADAIPGDYSASRHRRAGHRPRPRGRAVPARRGRRLPDRRCAPAERASSSIQSLGSQARRHRCRRGRLQRLRGSVRRQHRGRDRRDTAAGVKRIFWLTLRAARHPYLSMNDDIAAGGREAPAGDRRRLERVLAEPSGLVPDRRPAPARPRREGDGDADPQVAPRLRASRRSRPASRRRPAGRAPRQGVPGEARRDRGRRAVPLVAARARPARHPPRGERA